ncbi:Predicted membrane protein [Tistlia consotensis]|uniref:Predicted membrane protein n=1 Tax=Tistlia consotensis USBA 355 TaxID=560819 RepID=A0A1Y6CAB2_9PROT|nr:DUF2306 domain-containing protein [Tistlia consotensis]SMF51411.1 Predicted membrane protein [Tistlia consotensis USBA 355]SNR84365.1 Predicted membrane protein [Tistlia consotensis]
MALPTALTSLLTPLLTPYGLLLACHVIGGTLALAAGLTAMVAVKGGLWHRRAGRIFAVAMLAIVADALVMAVLKPNAFLFLVGLFSLYLVAVGWRAARLRDGRPRRLDWALAAAMLSAASVMIAWGLLQLARGEAFPGPVLLVFGLIGGGQAVADLRLFRRGGPQGALRICRHLGHMTGGFVAALTAFTVVNAQFLPELARWLGPTLLLAPVIVWWRWRLRRPAQRRAAA